jgi:signal transduction histidine kinase
MPDPIAHSAADDSASPPCATAFVLPDAGKLEAMAEFAAGAGHEINNPLATIIGRAQMLMKDEHNPQRRQMLQAIGAQAYRIRDMIGDAMLFGRPPAPDLGDIELAQVVADVLAKIADPLADAHCRIAVNVPDDIVVRADSTQLAIVLAELLRNSQNALDPAGGEIVIRAAKHEGRFARIEIEDHGRGFTDIERVHAFDPFFSGRQAGRGLGFGLPKCWRIVRQHGGEIEIESAPDRSTTVRMTWPLANSLK